MEKRRAAAPAFPGMKSSSGAKDCTLSPVPPPVRSHRCSEPASTAKPSARFANGATFFGRLGVEVQLHHTGGAESALAEALIEIAERARVPWVIAQDPRYTDNDSRLVHDILTALRYDTDIDTALKRGVLHPNGEWRLNSPEEMFERWRGREIGLYEAEHIASECDFDLGWMRPPLPAFPVPPGCDDNDFPRKSLRGSARAMGRSG